MSRPRSSNSTSLNPRAQATGLAVDFAPYQWWRDKQNIEDLRYHKDEGMEKALSVWLQRILVRTQISFATTKGSSDADKSSKFALGIHSVIANSDDPVNFAAPETVRGDKAVPDDADGLLNRRGRKLNAWVPVLGERVDRHDVPFDRDGLFAKAGNYFFNHVSWAVGAAPTWIAEGDGGHYEYSGMTAWSSFAYVPSEQTPVRFLLDAIYHEGEKIAATDAISPPPAVAGKKPGQIKQDSLLLTGGVNFGTRDFHATVTATYLGLDQYDFGSDSAFRYAIALEKRVTNNAWITLTLSKDDGHKDGKNPTLVLGGVKIGLGGTDFNAEDLRNIVE